MFRPKSVNIFSNNYSIKYFPSQIDTDRHREKHLWGQVDYITHSIRIFDNGMVGEAEVVSTILEEVLHVIQEDLRLKLSHQDLSRVSKGLSDVLVRNGWLKGKV